MAKWQGLTFIASKKSLLRTAVDRVITGIYGWSMAGANMLAERTAATTNLYDVTVVAKASPEERQQIAALLGQYAGFAGQALVLGKDPWHVLWSPDRTAFIPFFAGPFTLIAWRDPVGPEGERRALTERLVAYARAHHKQTLMIGLSEASLPQTDAEAQRLIWIGTEMYYDLAQFSLRGKANLNLRHGINSAHNRGAVERECFPLQHEADRLAMARVERAWKAADRGRNTDSFLRTAPLEDGTERRYFAIEAPLSEDAEPQMCAFIVCSKVSDQGWCLQDLIRLPDAPRGCLEAGVTFAMETFKAEGVGFASMSIVPFYDPTETHSLASYPPLAQWAINHFDRFYHFSGLQQFRSKFIPTRSQAVFVVLAPKVVSPLLLFDLLRVFSPFHLPAWLRAPSQTAAPIPVAPRPQAQPEIKEAIPELVS
jgi:phosphatidylglycerol lysyltransferase